MGKFSRNLFQRKEVFRGMCDAQCTHTHTHTHTQPVFRFCFVLCFDCFRRIFASASVVSHRKCGRFPSNLVRIGHSNVSRVICLVVYHCRSLRHTHCILFSKTAYRPISESDDWALKGEEALLKNLKKPMIKQFKTVLKAGHKDTPCIPMLRPGDGRLQVHYKKWRPHVITCRLYRWPDLLTHLELYPTAECQTPYTAKSKFVCLNPYHYRREKLAKGM